MNKEYIKLNDIILITNEEIINILYDFEKLELENIEKQNNAKITIAYHENIWSILCENNIVCTNIIEKIIICYSIWKQYKYNIIIRVDPKKAKETINISKEFIKNNEIKVKIYQSFEKSTIIFITGDNKSDVFKLLNFTKKVIDNYNDVNIKFLWLNLLNFVNNFKKNIPIDIKIGKDIKIKISNFDNNLIVNKNADIKYVCLDNISNNPNIIWYYIKKTIYDKNLNFFKNYKNIEYLDVEMNIKKKNKNDYERNILISRKIDSNKYQIPIHKTQLPNTIYSSSF